MKNISLVKLAHQFISDALSNGDLAVDATAGNGHDTLFLAQMIGNEGKVMAFDIQEQARQSTMNRLSEYGLKNRIEFLLTGHEHLDKAVTPANRKRLKAIMFNLGYLPHSDKKVRTCSERTLMALKHAVSMLAARGRLSIIAYRGHEGGSEETQAVIDWARQLPRPQYYYDIEGLISNINAPLLIRIEKRL